MRALARNKDGMALGTSYSWRSVMPLLVEAGYRVLVPDMRGYGDSDKPAGPKAMTVAHSRRTIVIEDPVMLQSILEKIIVYTPDAPAQGSMW